MRAIPGGRWGRGLRFALTPLLLAAAAPGADVLLGPHHRGPAPATVRLPSTGHGSAAPPSTTTTMLTPAQALAARLDAAFAGVPGCAVVEDASGIVVDRNGSQPFAPASTQKLLVAAAALTELGPNFRFTTTVVASGPPQAGVVPDLWLVGGGDPVLAAPEYTAFVLKQPRSAGDAITPLASLADQLVAAGVTTIGHPIHGDDSRYDRTRYLAAWPDVYRDEGDIGPLGALMVNDGFSKWEGNPVAPPDPAAYGASELSRLLAARTVTSPAGGDDGAAPANGTPLARVSSAPLSVLVPQMLRTSDNLTAELLTRELDHHAGGMGTTAGGLAIVTRDATRLGLSTTGVNLIDGSGLAPANRASCRALLGAFDLGQQSAPADPGLAVLRGGYAVAGQSGTLVHRLQHTPLAGHLEAKTGWITEASGMVGMMDLHGQVRFAFLANGPGIHRYADAEALENRVLVAIAAYPNG